MMIFAEDRCYKSLFRTFFHVCAYPFSGITLMDRGREIYNLFAKGCVYYMLVYQMPYILLFFSYFHLFADGPNLRDLLHCYSQVS